MVSNPSKQCSGKSNPAALKIPQIKLIQISDFQQQKKICGSVSLLFMLEIYIEQQTGECSTMFGATGSIDCSHLGT